jgi:hypothetical protein
LNIAYHQLTLASWIRSENQSGIFLTIPNSVTFLLVLGIRNNDNCIVVYWPNATNTNIGVNVIGSSMDTSCIYME